VRKLAIKNLGIVKIIRNERETISCDKECLETVFFQDGMIIVLRDTRKQSVKDGKIATCPLGILMSAPGKYADFEALYLYIHDTTVNSYNIEMDIEKNRIRLNFLEKEISLSV